MHERPSEDKAHAILMDALVSYSDACTLPDLTPSCPYYEVTDVGATCQEQCLALIQDQGAANRPIRDVQLGGLVMTGRALPLSVASGMSQFDAYETYLRDRRAPARQQSTSSLLLGLEAALCAFPIERNESRVERAFALWSELERRDLPISAIATEAILPSVASSIGVLSAIPAMREAGVWDNDVSTDFLDRVEVLAQQGWTTVLKDAIDAEPSREVAMKRAGRSGSRLQTPSGPASVFSYSEDDFDFSTEVREKLSANGQLPYAIANRFTGRVVEWLSRLLNEDMRALFLWQAPPSPVFLALSGPNRTPDEHARWIWDRYTTTRLDDWAKSSLLLEWRSHHDGSAPLSPRVWGERITEKDPVASLALEKSSQLARRPRRPERGLRPQEFVDTAVRHLKEGRVEDAANIFAGLAELRPADGDVLNNLGFCLMATEPEHALIVLQEASLYPRSQELVSSSNRALTLHLVGRDADAIAVAEEALDQDHHEGSCYMWRHTHDRQPLELVAVDDAREYLKDLLVHLRLGAD